jgi:hypothetical protein
MYIRFCGGEIHAASQVAAGLFNAASDLRLSDGLADHDFEAITGLKCWFDEHLASPYDYLHRAKRYERAVCWFKSTAHEHLARAWELVTILERNDVLIWTIKSHRVGYVHYEDKIQVFARPYDDVRRLLGGRRK